MKIPTINKCFIDEWAKKFDEENPDAKKDEDLYQECILSVEKDRKSGNCMISPQTLKKILYWKDRPRD